ncbi:hypothetical protein BaRGS_00035498 [Batillaria attramentaria]|uniref:Uncharacterized protein n=1 Tax=Batillaria attramentaria TaxID=370345 RepID=A0ABD0JEM6_9CAEN
MSEASVNSTARLRTGRWFRATSTTLRQYTLEFKYYIGQSNACQLAVFLETDEEPRSFTELFSTQRGTGEDLKSVSPIWLPYVDCRHRIVFEARKVSTGHCGFTGNENYNEVEIDDIVFADNGLMTTTTPSVPPQSAATTGTSPSSMTAHTQTTHTTSLSTESFTTTEPTLRASTTSLTSASPAVLFTAFCNYFSDRKEHSSLTAGQNQIPSQPDEAEDHLKIGLISGFAVAAVVVVVCIVVLVLVIRRRQVEKPRKTM